MRNLRFVTLVVSVVYLVLSIVNTAVYVVYAMNGFQDPTYYQELVLEALSAFNLSESEVSALANVLVWYYLLLAIEDGIGVFFDIFYIQACRRNFLKGKAPYIVLGILGIIFGQLFPGILFIVLGAKSGGQKEGDDPNIIDNSPRE
ncbi:MAG: hypothetical protein K6B65_04230 [Bacilli bacterium]|nr:hypothetical protein [Bacilli bacterium]